MKYAIYLALLILVIGLSFGVLEPLNLGWVTPSLLLLIVVCLSMQAERLDFFWFGVAGGFWLDIYFGLPVGSFAGAYLLIGVAGSSLFKQWLAEPNWKYYLLCVGLAEIILLVWLWGYTNILFSVQWGAVAISGRQLVHELPLLLLGAALGAFPVYGLVNWVIGLSKRLVRKPYVYDK